MSANGSYGDILVDAAISASSAAFGVFAGLGVSGVLADYRAAALGAAIAGGVSFFASLRAARNRGGGDAEAPA